MTILPILSILSFDMNPIDSTDSIDKIDNIDNIDNMFQMNPITAILTILAAVSILTRLSIYSKVFNVDANVSIEDSVITFKFYLPVILNDTLEVERVSYNFYDINLNLEQYSMC